MKVELSGGEWAVLREDVEDLTNGELRPLRVAFADYIAKASGEASVTADELLLTTLITEWSFHLPLPSASPGSLEQIKARDYRQLVKASGPFFDRLFGNAGPQEVDPTPGSPTDASEPLPAG